MTKLRKIAAALGVVGAMAAGSVMPALAVGVHIGPHGVYIGHGYHHYYNYGGNPCGNGFSLQGGRCRPYHYGPWDVYGGTHQDWGYR